MIIGLKACPFCGKSGIADTTEHVIHYAGCQDIRCIGFQIAYDFDTVELAVAAWENRTVLVLDTEKAAKAIYNLFEGSESHPWVEGGNSLKQDEARRYARVVLENIDNAKKRQKPKANLDKKFVPVTKI